MWNADSLVPTRLAGPARLLDVAGTLSVEVDDQWRVGAEFGCDEVLPQIAALFAEGAAPPTIEALLDDGRRVDLHGCRCRNSVLFPPLVPLKVAAIRVSVHTARAAPGAVEFALAGLNGLQCHSFLCDDRMWELRPASIHVLRRSGPDADKRARVTHWLSCPVGEGEFDDAYHAAVRLAWMFTLLQNERVVIPCARCLSAGGREERVDYWLSTMPVQRMSLMSIPTKSIPALLSDLGSVPLQKHFEELELAVCTGYLLEARRVDIPVEVGLMCALVSLECLTEKWLIARSVPAKQLVSMNLPRKLGELDDVLHCIDERFKQKWLAFGLRNPLFHTGIVAGMSLHEIGDVTEDLLRLVIDITFAVLGLKRQQYLAQDQS